MQIVDADIRADRQAFGLGLAHQFHTGRTGQATHVHASAGAAHDINDGVQSNGFCRHRHTAQTQSRGQRSAGSHAFAQMHVLRSEPDDVAVSGGVLHGALQSLGLRHAVFGL